MIKHKIYAHHIGIHSDMRLSIPLIKKSVKIAIELEGVNMPCEVSVLIVNNHQIREINHRFRGIDKPTDVLSFPMQVFLPGDFTADNAEPDPQTGFLELGDIVLSAERVLAQADEYGHSTARETAYLTVHSVLHLLGYDHMEKSDKKKMRAREEFIMQRISIDNL